MFILNVQKYQLDLWVGISGWNELFESHDFYVKPFEMILYLATSSHRWRAFGFCYFFSLENFQGFVICHGMVRLGKSAQALWLTPDFLDECLWSTRSGEAAGENVWYSRDIQEKGWQTKLPSKLKFEYTIDYPLLLSSI